MSGASLETVHVQCDHGLQNHPLLSHGQHAALLLQNYSSSFVTELLAREPPKWQAQRFAKQERLKELRLAKHAARLQEKMQKQGGSEQVGQA